ncbi:hypothetical protein ASE86_14670 [Sphingomonas sp. Leaf33]|uniref:methyltransferase domain-containing protein n=1 Tax=Sphingomonas sp. Leaf33 TaxID=1736215 RepID=UPI0006F96508|nr:methyltransferase domain-containing protein [Sphingomonas sp. Leaf33]KQN21215.1 hypothetical protein ASE86_14670 [Sphingomonas sp. Leaf33]
MPHTPMPAIATRYPHLAGSPRAMAMTAAALHLSGRTEDAVELALAAVAAAPADMIVHQTVRRALNRGVARFHDSMMRDEVRNRAYARAIEAAVRPGMTVLEIGAGSGLLAMIAARAGARVVTCEAVPAVAATARTIVARNGYADRVRVVAKRSTDLEIGVDLDEPADLLVHEIFGHMLVNEGVTAAVADARARLLKPGAPSVPPRAEIRVALAAFIGQRSPQIGEIEGFDLSPFGILLPPRGASILDATGRIAPRSEPASLLRMEYDSPAPFGPDRETVRLVSTGGSVDLVAQWMRIDFGGGNMLGTDPFADGQAVSWGAPLFLLPMPIKTTAGDGIDVTVRHDGHALTIDAAAAG